MRDTSKDPEIHSYLAEVTRNKIRNRVDDMVTVNDLEIVYEFGLTPQLENEPGWCIFSVNAIKQAFGQNQKLEGEFIVDFAINFGYKIKEQGTKIHPEVLFGLLFICHHNLTEKFKKAAKGTYAENYILTPPKYEDMEKDIRGAIIGQGISKQ